MFEEYLLPISELPEYHLRNPVPEPSYAVIAMVMGSCDIVRYHRLVALSPENTIVIPKDADAFHRIQLDVMPGEKPIKAILRAEKEPVAEVDLRAISGRFQFFDQPLSNLVAHDKQRLQFSIAFEFEPIGHEKTPNMVDIEVFCFSIPLRRRCTFAL